MKLIGMTKVIKPAELNITPNGAEVCNLTVVHNRRYKKGEEMVDEATFVRLTAWGQKAKFLSQYAPKGVYLFVTATLAPTIRIWQNDEGEAMAGYEATINEVEIAWPQREKQEVEPDSLNENEIPF